MTFERGNTLARTLFLGALCVVLSVCAWTLTRKVRGSVDLDQATIALKKVNAPCTVFHGSWTCGPIDGASQTEKNIGILAAQGAEQVKLSGALVQATTRNLDAVSASVVGTMGHLNDATDAIKVTATQSGDSIKAITDHLNSVLDKSKMTLADVDDAVKLHSKQLAVSEKDFDDLLAGPVTQTTQQIALTSVQVTGIATDIRKEADSVTKPQPWYRKAMGYGNMGVNIACLATHSCPF